MAGVGRRSRGRKTATAPARAPRGGGDSPNQDAGASARGRGRSGSGSRLGGKTRLLTAIEEKTVRAALAAGCTRDEAARLANISRSLLDTRLRAGEQLADVRVGQGRRERRRPRGVDPTPAEIALRAALIRRGWGDDRWGLRSPDPADLEGRYSGR